jgi:uncharacterized protein DUF3551
MEVVMRIILPALAILLGSSLFAPSKADPYAWCAEYTGGGLGGSSNCYFTTLEQCRATVSGVGGYCSPNPFYTGNRTTTQRRARVRNY